MAEIRRRAPDLVLLDLLMPGMDGFEMLTQLREDPETREIPVIVATGRTLSAQEQSFLSRNARKVVSKQALERDMLATGLATLLSGVELREP